MSAVTPPKDVIEAAAFTNWVANLRNDIAQSAVAARIAQIRLGNFGDTEYARGGVNELRIHSPGGYRIYYARAPDNTIVLLFGGRKDGQQKDIETSHSILKKLKKEWRKIQKNLLIRKELAPQPATRGAASCRAYRSHQASDKLGKNGVYQ